MHLRPAQAEILAYRGGRLAVNAVPGSGKTFTLSYLAAQLIADGKIDPDQQQVLIVTYLNSSVSNFRASVRQRLEEMELSAEIGFDVRTLHSLAREITRVADGGLGDSAEIPVLDDVLRETYLHNAVNSWIEANHGLWSQFLTDNNPQTRSRWRDSTFSMARAFIRTAKNERWTHDQIQATLRQNSAEGNDPNAILLAMNAGIYAIYQAQLIRQGVRDFDDLIWDAVDLLETRPSLAAELRERWPYVLEDEAQDSVPLQEVLLTTLTGPDGNWVRVGDPNQAITSTFTAAHPRFFNAFIARPDVVNLPLPNSGRSAPMIFGAANALLDWVIDEHPEPEVRAHTFLRQHILPTPEGDAQPNPPDAEANVVLKVYKSREDEEIPTVARLALEYVRKFPQRTAAILTPTNRLGFSFADWLDDLEAPYDNLLHGNSRQREIASSMHAILALLADPLSNRELVSAHASLHELQHPAAQISAELVPDGATEEAALDQIHNILRSVRRTEDFLFPKDGYAFAATLPKNIASPAQVTHLEGFARYLRTLFDLRSLPVDDMALALGDDLFTAGGNARESDLAIAYQIATLLRSWRVSQPDWRLPELATELRDVALGRARMPFPRLTDIGFEPQPGRITLATQHSAKGLEWDAVFLVGIDGFWIPGSLTASFQGVDSMLEADLTAEISAQLRHLMLGSAGLYERLNATDSAHIDVISERLRLLYVGITRAKRFLQISRSRVVRQGQQERDVQPATALQTLYNYLQTYPRS